MKNPAPCFDGLSRADQGPSRSRHDAAEVEPDRSAGDRGGGALRRSDLLRRRAHTAGLSDEFVDWFAIAGPPETARPRFQQLAAIGLDFCRVVPGSTDMPRDIAVTSLLNLAREIVPALHGDPAQRG